MEIVTQMSDFVMPVLICSIVGYGLFAKVRVYESFLKGAAEGLKVAAKILPTLIGLLLAVGILRASGFFEMVEDLLEPVTALVGLPAQILPLLIMKVFSSSAATGLLLDIFATAGPDSFPGRLASILMSCTETIFYTMSVYFLAAKVTKTRYTLAGALVATLGGVVASVLLAGRI